ncbi:hypothetical protein BDB01DRAFT_835045 [Pilobolus umbonatus]|nr:hypothetical protein BDB01DRAFT_835045 [Pilobolus umbonatus]
MYIDLSWNHNSVLFIDSNNKETCIKNTGTVIENCITSKYKKMLELVKQMPQSREKDNSSADKVVELLDVESISDPSVILALSDLHLYLSYPDLLEQIVSDIPKDYQKEMMLMYIECLQLHIIQNLISISNINKADTLTSYFSIDQSIPDTFLTDHQEIRSIFEQYNTKHLSRHLMKLIHREQVSAVHCKNAIECYNRVEEYLDYPQYMMQVQLNPTYIDLAFNVILPLTEDITLSKQETALTLKRKRIPFDTVNLMGDLLWDYIQSREEVSLGTCHKHEQSDYEDNADMYLQFIDHFRQWFTREYTMVNNQGQIEWYKELHVEMNTQCDCTFVITPMNIFDICIIPAIQQIMYTIYGATTNENIFGEHETNHVALMGSIMNIKCNKTHKNALYLLDKCIKNQKKYYNHITLHWITDETSTNVYEGIKGDDAPFI